MHRVVILGAGMAGMACARALTRLGHRPCLVAPEHDAANRGETLSFRAAPFLEKLGWSGFLDADAAIACQGRYSVWGSSALRQDTFQQEGASGWHIDRPRLEVRMAESLVGCVERIRGEARQLSRAPGRIVIDLADGAAIEAGYVIDCSGRASVTAGSATPPRRLDRLVACYGIYSLDDDVEVAPATLVEAVASGWWYMSVMPGARVLLGFFTDSDLLPQGLRKNFHAWADMASRTHAVSARLGSLGIDAAALDQLQFAPASTTTMSRLIEHRIIRAGDAASALDPLGANGLATALWGGVRAADSVIGLLAGDDAPSRLYEQQFLEGITSHLVTQRAMYASETRFMHEPFWQRRRGGPG